MTGLVQIVDALEAAEQWLTAVERHRASADAGEWHPELEADARVKRETLAVHIGMLLNRGDD